jgi:excinuclease ABC subunit A
MQDQIVVRGASQHNLKHVSLAVPKGRLVVVTGVSGSGKSSLAFDTIYAEGQRRYVESLSAYARQFLEQMEKPEVEQIEGLSPAIAIEQRAAAHNPRSTVGTVTEILDYLRVLFARAGTPRCHRCGREIASMTVQQMTDRILAQPEGTRLMILAPVVRGRKGEHRALLEAFARKGFVRARVDGAVVELAAPPTLDGKRAHTVEIVVDRLAAGPGAAGRLADSLEIALREGGGLATAVFGDGTEATFSEKLSCVRCGTSVPEMSPRTFSFNSPYGACPGCDGLGSRPEFDAEAVVPDPSLPLAGGAIAAPGWAASAWLDVAVKAIQRKHRFDPSAPFRRLPARVREILLHGSGDEELTFDWKLGRGRYTFRRPFEGVIPNLRRRYRESRSARVRDEIARLMVVRPCAECGGARLRPEARSVVVAGRGIHEYAALDVGSARRAFGSLELPGAAAAVARPLLKEVGERLSFLEAVGLSYLTLDRAASTLSGGESQRIRLATQIGSRLGGVLYVLDEPSIGLHARDNRRLLDTLRALRDLGNTLLVVEHDEETIRAADHVVDLGPGAGEQGGEVVASGSVEDLVREPRSLTGAYLSGRLRIETPAARRSPRTGAALVVRGASENNLRGIDVAFPLGLFIAVTGVSGSGKSTLVNEILHKALARRLHGAQEPPGRHEGIDGAALLDKVIAIDQSPIGRTPRSNPATYTGAFAPIRDLFAMVPEARARGYTPGRFSFNVKGGRCEACQGDGVKQIEMHFLPDVHVTCDACGGRRYNRETLEIRYKGRNIDEVLSLSVESAAAFFGNVPAVARRLETLLAVGLGYVRLGQPATTLSGGEAQRVKLSRELGREATGRTLYLLDEPTTGLHFDDVRKLLEVLGRLVDAGNTVVVIEHNLDVIRTADHVVDLGPEGGAEGGRVVAAGTPEEVARVEGSHTGGCLRRALGIEARAAPAAAGG